jgi:hypothetical protein
VSKARYGSNETYRLKYPTGRQAYQMMGLYDDKTGLYFAAHDPVGIDKSLAYSFYPEGGLKFYVEYFADNDGAMANSQSFDFATVFGFVEGDWYDAAQVYRKFVSEKAKWWPARNLDYWQKRPGLLDSSFWLAVVGPRSNLIDKTRRIRQEMGVPIGAHWYRWNVWGFDENFPNAFPPQKDFARTVLELQANGISVMPYILARLWDTKLESYDLRAVEASIKKRDLSTHFINSERVNFAIMCPNTNYWQSTITDITDKLFTEYQVDGIYIDQVAASAPSRCYDPNHGHPVGSSSSWVEGYRQMLTKIRQNTSPWQYLTSEMNAEPYLNHFEAYLNWWWVFPDQQPIYQAIYGGQYMSFGRKHEHDDELAVVTKTAQQLVYGEQIGWFFGEPDKLFSGAFPFLVAASQSYYQLRMYFAGGRMLRPLKPTSALDLLSAKWYWRGHNEVQLPVILNGVWQAEGGNIAAIFVNSSEQHQEASFHLGKDLPSKEFKQSSSSKAKASLSQDAIKVSLPARSILLLEF